MKEIRNPDANPILALLLNIFVLAGLGEMVIGQNRKGITVFLCALLGTCMCCVPGILVVVLSHVDVYLSAAALQRGETLGENEYKQELLYKIVKIFDKTAVYRG
jgi:TM2 domain-containing membrane protein YozV